MDFKLQIVVNEQEMDLFTNCSLLTVLSRLNNATKKVKSTIDDKPNVEQRMSAIQEVIKELDDARIRLLNQHEIINDVLVLLNKKDSDDERQLELNLE